MPTLIGPRIYLREYLAEDIDAFCQWSASPEIMELTTFRFKNREEALEALQHVIEQSKSKDRTLYTFAVEVNGTQTFVGGAGFTINARNETGGIAEIGYFLLKEFWGQGYATEIAELLTEYIFQTLRLHKVIASCDKRNVASERVMIKAGMTKEGEFPMGRLAQGSWCDGLQYGLLSSEWNARKA